MSLGGGRDDAADLRSGIADRRYGDANRRVGVADLRVEAVILGGIEQFVSFVVGAKMRDFAIGQVG